MTAKQSRNIFNKTCLVPYNYVDVHSIVAVTYYSWPAHTTQHEFCVDLQHVFLQQHQQNFNSRDAHNTNIFVCKGKWL